ncbi:VQ motif-containing protein 22-like [Salvia splendens]|uniref:VQ motif-containing protein 22-like n=1 Tax=Salvia splendens TaxID=180675 RepID=UPI001C26152E|nr:VQ motif-containing protein 22-like [Salvia splendens]
MAISQTMSNPSDWLFQPYQNDFSQNINTSPTAALANGSSSSSSNNNNNNNNHLSPEEGRVAKPARRRSRASRRTPTTLLNADAANFRAMVQHFTGGPAAASLAAGQHPIPNRVASYVNHVAVAAAAGGFHVQYPQQQPQSMFVMDNGGGGGVPPQTAAGNGINYGNFMV